MLSKLSLPADVEVIDGGTQGLGIVNLMAERQRVVFVDAAEMGRPPGQFVRFTPDQARLLGDDVHLSVHAAGLRDALLLSQTLQVLPGQVIIFGVQPASLEWGSELSAPVEAALPDLVAAILAEVAIEDRVTTTGSEPDKGENKHGENPDD
jgi:hydrogenase maturation protease